MSILRECPSDAYPIPRVEELIDRLGKAKLKTMLDLALGPLFSSTHCNGNRKEKGK